LLDDAAASLASAVTNATASGNRKSANRVP